MSDLAPIYESHRDHLNDYASGPKVCVVEGWERLEAATDEYRAELARFHCNRPTCGCQELNEKPPLTEGSLLFGAPIYQDFIEVDGFWLVNGEAYERHDVWVLNLTGPEVSHAD